MYEEYFGLIAAVIRSALQKEGPQYLSTGDGQYWCWLAGLDPQLTWELAIKSKGPTCHRLNPPQLPGPAAVEDTLLP